MWHSNPSQSSPNNSTTKKKPGCGAPQTPKPHCWANHPLFFYFGQVVRCVQRSSCCRAGRRSCTALATQAGRFLLGPNRKPVSPGVQAAVLCCCEMFARIASPIQCFLSCSFVCLLCIHSAFALDTLDPPKGRDPNRRPTTPCRDALQN
jgi:hypothetical protein